MSYETLAMIIGLLGAGIGVGAALGYYTAAQDTAKEVVRAWERGHDAGVQDCRHVTETLRRGLRPAPYTPNPYQEETK